MKYCSVAFSLLLSIYNSTSYTGKYKLKRPRQAISRTAEGLKWRKRYSKSIPADFISFYLFICNDTGHRPLVTMQ